MPGESQIPSLLRQCWRQKRFAASLALFYGAIFASIGAQMPFFSGLAAGCRDRRGVDRRDCRRSRGDAIHGLPFIVGLAEKRGSLHTALIVTAFMTALGFAAVGTQHQAIPVFLAYAATSCMWTPIVPLTDAHALRGVVRYGLNYGPLRLWGSAAFVVGALACGFWSM